MVSGAKQEYFNDVIKRLDSTWTNCENNSKPTITVLNPNSRETLTRGSKYTVMWSRSGVFPPDSVLKIRLLSDLGNGGHAVYPLYTLPSGNAQTLSYTWAVDKASDGTVIPDGSSYKIQVVAVDSGGATTLALDESDAPFSITTPLGKVSPCGKYGDVDSDGYLTDKDIEIIRQDILAVKKMTPEQKIRADVSNEGKVTTLDISYIRAYLLGTKTTFPVCTVPQPFIPISNFSESSQLASVLESIRATLEGIKASLGR